MIPTDLELAAAVDGAARANYSIYQAVFGPAEDFDDLPAEIRHEQRRAVRPVISAALEALPDRATELRRRVAGHLEPVSGRLVHHSPCEGRWGGTPCTCGLRPLLEDLAGAGA